MTWVQGKTWVRTNTTDVCHGDQSQCRSIHDWSATPLPLTPATSSSQQLNTKCYIPAATFWCDDSPEMSGCVLKIKPGSLKWDIIDFAIIKLHWLFSLNTLDGESDVRQCSTIEEFVIVACHLVEILYTDTPTSPQGVDDKVHLMPTDYTHKNKTTFWTL